MIYKKISWLQTFLIGLLLVPNLVHAKLDINFEDTKPEPKNPAVTPNPQNIESDKNVSEVFEQHEKPLDITPVTHEITQELPPKISKTKLTKRKKEKLLSFDFIDEPLANIVNIFAAKKGINIVLPQDKEFAEKKITLDQKKKITLLQAEKYIDSFLDLFGYGVFPNNDFYVISKKTDNNNGREPVTLYVNVPPDELPKTTEPIRAIYYLSNFQVPKNSGEAAPLNSILKDMVGDKKFLYDERSNGIILSANADKIASAMTIILSLDATGATEIVEVFPLFYADAAITATLMTAQIAQVSSKAQAGSRVQIKGEAGVYFAPNTVVRADPRTNSLILIGTESAVIRIKDFVGEYIDTPPESGRSILHIYELQYLNAEDFAKVLEQIVTTKSASGQSQKEPLSGPQRFFEDVIITYESKNASAAEAREITGTLANSATAKGKVALGGNRLLISAKNDDWLMIKHLIEKLDKPELQVIIEVMILDITLDATKILNSQIRNPVGIPLHDNIQYQSVNIGTSSIVPGVAVTVPPSPATAPMISLTADLLELLTAGGSSLATPASSGGNLGSMIISFKDPCQDAVWAVMQIFNSWGISNVISHPFIVTKNNIKGRENLVITRRGFGRDVSSGGNVTIKVEDYPARVSVEVTPRISSLDRLNIQIRVEVSNFTSALGAAPTNNDFTTNNRIVETNATLSTGQILVLGGLTQDLETETETKWPILGDIPVFGPLFFRGASKSKTKNNLAIIVHPTIVNSKLRAGQQKHTKEKIDTRREYMESNVLFGSVKDPVTRLFFADMGNNGVESLDEYLRDTHYLVDTKEDGANLAEQKDLDSEFFSHKEQKAFDASFDKNLNDQALPESKPNIAAI